MTVLQPAAPKKFDEHFNNIKIILIFTVVLGHFSEIFFRDHFAYNAIYEIIYAFHMPMFIIVTGYFSKNADKARSKAFSEILIPYVLFEIFMSLGESVMKGEFTFPDIFTPQTAAWYLISTFLWRMLLKDVIKIRYNIVFFMLLSLYIGFLPGVTNMFSLDRTIVFFPYFLVGYYFDERAKNIINKIPYFIAAILFAAACFGVTFISRPMAFSAYSQMGMTVFEGVGERLGMYFVALFMSAMLYRIIPKKRQFFSFIGPYTMTVFLLHTFVKMAVANNKTQFDGLNPYVGIVLFVLLSAILTVLLGNKYVFAVYKWCIDLCKKIIFKKRMVINNEN